MTLPPKAIDRLTSPNSEQRVWLRSSLRQTVSCRLTKVADASTGLSDPPNRQQSCGQEGTTTAPRTEDIAATADEMQQLLAGITPAWRDYLRGKLNPRAPYERRAIAAGIWAAAAKLISWEQFGHFVMRLLDSDYGKGTNSFRTQKELGALLGRSERTVQRADAAIQRAGLGTRLRSRREAAKFTLVTREQLDRVFKDLGGERDMLPQDPPSNMADQGMQDPPPVMASQGPQDLPLSRAVQDNPRPATPYGGSKIETRQNKHVRPAAESGGQPYYIPKKKETGPRQWARQIPDVIGAGLLTWAIRGDHGWSQGYRAEFGPPPDSESCGIYAHGIGALSRGLDYVRAECAERHDPSIRARIELISRHIEGVRVAS